MLKITLLLKDGVRPINNQRGFTLVEALVAATLVAIIGAFMAQVISTAQMQFKRLKDKKAQERQIVSMINEMNANINKFEVNMDPSIEIDGEEGLYPTIDDYPYYWNNRFDYMTEEDCLELYQDLEETCPLEGRMAYLLQPVPQLPGMYKATILSTHRFLDFKPDMPEIKRVTVFIKAGQ